MFENGVKTRAMLRTSPPVSFSDGLVPELLYPFSVIANVWRYDSQIACSSGVPLSSRRWRKSDMCTLLPVGFRMGLTEGISEAREDG